MPEVRRDLVLRIALGVLLAHSGVAAGAAPVPPDAGDSLRSLQPVAPSPPAPVPEVDMPSTESPRTAVAAPGVAVHVIAFAFEGNTVFPSSRLQAALGDLPGRTLTLDDLQSATARVTAMYRSAGYLLARAWLPPQDVSDGTVLIRVLEGKLESIHVDNRSALPPRLIDRALRTLRPGNILRADDLEQGLLDLSDLPGARPHARLEPGEQAGGTRMDVDLQPDDRLHGNLRVDNDGNRFTGLYRLSGELDVASPLGQGDALTLSTTVSDAGQHFLRAQYEIPAGPRNTRIGVGDSWMDYALGREFSALDANGNARILSLYAAQSWLHLRSRGFSTRVSYDHKSLDDRTGAFALDDRRHLDNLTLTASGYARALLSAAGSTAWSLDGVLGNNVLLDAGAAAQDAATLHTAGRFAKLDPVLQQQDWLGPRLSLGLSARAQLASRNLDSAEKFSLGGAGGIRAYPEGEAPGDEGWLVRAELRRHMGDAWQAGIFVDSGGVVPDRNPIAPSTNRRQLTGAGLLTEWKPDHHWTAGLSAAVPVGGERPTSDKPRSLYLWGLLARSF